MDNKPDFYAEMYQPSTADYYIGRPLSFVPTTSICSSGPYGVSSNEYNISGSLNLEYTIGTIPALTPIPSPISYSHPMSAAGETDPNFWNNSLGLQVQTMGEIGKAVWDHASWSAADQSRWSICYPMAQTYIVAQLGSGWRFSSGDVLSNREVSTLRPVPTSQPPIQDGTFIWDANRSDDASSSLDRLPKTLTSPRIAGYPPGAHNYPSSDIVSPDLSTQSWSWPSSETLLVQRNSQDVVSPHWSSNQYSTYTTESSFDRTHPHDEYNALTWNRNMTGPSHRSIPTTLRLGPEIAFRHGHHSNSTAPGPQQSPVELCPGHTHPHNTTAVEHNALTWDQGIASPSQPYIPPTLAPELVIDPGCGHHVSSVGYPGESPVECILRAPPPHSTTAPPPTKDGSRLAELSNVSQFDGPNAGSAGPSMTPGTKPPLTTIAPKPDGSPVERILQSPPLHNATTSPPAKKRGRPAKPREVTQPDASNTSKARPSKARPSKTTATKLPPKTSNQQKKRRSFDEYDENAREETAKTRKRGACLRCRLQRLRVCRRYDIYQLWAGLTIQTLAVFRSWACTRLSLQGMCRLRQV